MSMINAHIFMVDLKNFYPFVRPPKDYVTLCMRTFSFDIQSKFMYYYSIVIGGENNCDWK